MDTIKFFWLASTSHYVLVNRMRDATFQKNITTENEDFNKEIHISLPLIVVLKKDAEFTDTFLKFQF